MSLKKNLWSNFILTGATILFPLITFPYLTRTLSNEGFGRVLFIDAFTQYFIIFSSLGIPFYGLREVAKIRGKKLEVSKLVTELVTIQVILAIFFSIAFLLISIFVEKLKNDIELIIYSCVIIISNSFLIEWFYQGIERFTYITKRSLILKALNVICILILVRGVNDFKLYYLILAAFFVINACINFIRFLKDYHITPNGMNLIKHLKPLIVLFSINVSISIYAVLDTVILGLFTNPINLSYYSVSLKLVKMFWMLVGGLGVVFIPKMSNYFIDKDFVSIRNLIQNSLSIVLLLTIPFCIYSIIFPLEIITVVLGTKYLPAVNVLRILSVVPLIIGVCNVFGTQFLLPIGKEKQILFATIIGLILSLILNFTLIPKLGFIGSSITCVAAELAVCIYIFMVARKEIKISFDFQLIFHIMISIILSIALVRILGLPGILSLIFSLILYILFFLLLQFFVFKNNFINLLLRNLKIIK